MKKLSILFLILFTVLLSSCVSSNVKDKETMQVNITNKCNWAIGVTIRVGSLYSNNLHAITLGTTKKTIELYKDTDYMFLIKGAYDLKPEQHKIHIDDQQDIYINWSSYKNSYVIQYKPKN